jgi:hypothetical protein
MHKATITSLSQFSGENYHEIEDDNLMTFYAQIVGTVQGITAAGAVITSVVTETVEV